MTVMMMKVFWVSIIIWALSALKYLNSPKAHNNPSTEDEEPKTQGHQASKWEPRLFILSFTTCISLSGL